MTKHPVTPFRAAALAGALAALVGVAAAAGERGPAFPLSVADAAARAEARFVAMDTDGSGEISAAELAAAPRPEGSRRHGNHDGPFHHPRGDGDRRPEADAELFDQLDADSDGQLSREEFTAERIREARRDGFRARMFARLDTDGSGGLSRDELPDPSARLAEMDADGDGTVTREEARAHHPKRPRQDDDRG
ncbi:MAG: EF-hand domain-containing protein [Pseudomonadales bacterium]